MRFIPMLHPGSNLAQVDPVAMGFGRARDQCIGHNIPSLDPMQKIDVTNGTDFLCFKESFLHKIPIC
jgi:hypothetical protein